ncbi:hypothetical protein LCGC14_1560260 [marine sediment metagenome]|uniref:HTH marR-type domain-containing protein n=1 Tax=marine sediment metagenome TaxID=412755 RepID=A0A0F9IMP2_9ZZZZ
MSFLNRRSRNIPPNATFRLTQEGREKLQEFSGDPKSRILVALETRGTSDISEMSSASGLNRGHIERMIPQLVRGGYISYVSAPAFEDQV